MAYKGKILVARSCGTSTKTADINFGTSEEYYANFNKYNPYLMFVGPSGNVARLPSPVLGFPYDQSSAIDYVCYTSYQKMSSMSGYLGLADTHLGSNDMVWAGNELIFANRFSMTYAFCPYQLETIHQVSGYQTRLFLEGWSTIGRITHACERRHLVQGGHYKMLSIDGGTVSVNDTVLNAHSVVLVGDDVFATINNEKYDFRYKVHTQQRYMTPDYMSTHGLRSHAVSGYIGLCQTVLDGLQRYLYGLGIEITPQNILHAAYDVIKDSDMDSVQHCNFFWNGKIYTTNCDRIGYTYPNTSIINYYKDLLREGQHAYYDQDGTLDSFNFYVNQSPITNPKYYFNSQYKCPIKFKDKLLFLQPDGKLLKEEKGMIKQQADISSFIDGNRGSGLISGNLGNGKSPSTYKCYGVRLGNTLHVFLNYYLGGSAIDGDVRGGVIWATSDDLVNFTDKTDSIPQSGVVAPSGMDYLNYISTISPYRFSGYNNFNGVTSGNQPAKTLGGDSATPCRPSGWMQKNEITSVWNSGTFIDNDYSKSPDKWDVPMSYDVQTQFLTPTNIILPIGFCGKDGVGATPAGKNYMEPYGVAHSGLAWNGVCPYHIFGYKDQTEEKVHLFFTEGTLYNNYEGDEGSSDVTADNAPNQTLYYTLDSDNNWTFMNQFLSKRIGWVEPTDVNEPSIILPSGSPKHREFPYEDRTQGVVYQPFRVFDYPFFRNVDIEAKYSTDYGATWYDATPHSTLCDYQDLDTGSISVDPSGVIGKKYMFVWDYLEDIPQHEKHPFVKLKIRAKADA